MFNKRAPITKPPSGFNLLSKDVVPALKAS